MNWLNIAPSGARLRCGSGRGGMCGEQVLRYARSLRGRASESLREVRARAARTPGELMDGQAVTWRRHALTDRSWCVRNNAAAGLANLPGEAEALRNALDDWDPYARDVAAAMLPSSDLARRAVARLEADDPVERERARSPIAKLVEAGNEEYFCLDGNLEIVQQQETLHD